MWDVVCGSIGRLFPFSRSVRISLSVLQANAYVELGFIRDFDLSNDEYTEFYL